MRLAPEPLEPVAQVLSGPPLGIRARRSRAELIYESLSLREGVHANLALHVGRLCPGWDSNPHVLSDNRF
jgi:hypothetical protein